MNQCEQNTDANVVTTTPLFASTWLALFNVLRKNYYERRLEASSNTERPPSTVKSKQPRNLN